MRSCFLVTIAIAVEIQRTTEGLTLLLGAVAGDAVGIGGFDHLAELVVKVGG